jgi:class 3 adenylate cyclase
MKLRTRLFLWIGVIFFLAFGLSLVFETRSVDKSLVKAEKGLREQILSLNEERRQHMEKYLHVSLSEDQAEIDALLLHIAGDPAFGATLFLDPKNIKDVAPAHLAFLQKDEKWINFAQSSRNGELTSLLIPLEFPLSGIRRIRINDELSWLFKSNDKGLEQPYLGVTLPVLDPEKTRGSLSLLVDELMVTEWGMTLLFHPSEVALFDKEKVKEEGMVRHAANIPALVKSLEAGALYLKPHFDKGEEAFKAWIHKELEEKGALQILNEKQPAGIVSCLGHSGQPLNTRLVQLLQRGDQALMISALANLFPSGLFGDSPFDSTGPVGIARFNKASSAGDVLFTRDVFFQKKLFEDDQYIQKHPSSHSCEGVGSSLAIIAPKDFHRVFIGNTLELKSPKNPALKGLLTLGVDSDVLVEDLVLSMHQAGVLVHGGRIVSAFDPDGQKISLAKAELPLTKEMQTSTTGIVKWKDQSFYYMHMQPFKDLDLHFYLFEPEKSAFALVRSVTEGSREVISTVSFNMRIIAVVALVLVLFLLHKVAKRITEPIAVLAVATEQVTAGRLDDVKLPDAPKGRKDEIGTLCRSFEEMVTGLKEKEKVKGVLNKVVSQEIAQEIMKGTIHLGGEEKKVTVFFADIRDFTHMSSHLEPAEVIEMLNLCMTKVSHVIDEFGGVIDKYIGDAVMALFGAPIDKGDSALMAIRCGLKIVETLSEWNRERAQAGLPPIEMGIGIHSGNVLVGNMGAENRLNYTVIGNNVNLASRLCGVATPMQVLISPETYAEPHVKENIEVESLPPIELKGYEEKVSLLAVKGKPSA